MKTPEFFETIEKIALKDPLAEILGAMEKGEYEISYLEVVKSAGHSCPTVAGAYIMTLEALKALYDGRAIRGDIEVMFKESLEDGVAGVVANVVTQITGATDKSGFKGLGNQFARHSLMHFNAEISTSARFTSRSSGKSVEVVYDPSMILANPNMMPLMQKIMAQDASQEERKLFTQMWQERVKNIFANIPQVLTLKQN